MDARDFFVDWYVTALEPGELVTAVLLPRPEAGAAGLYVKHARVAGDYATASVAACRHADGRVNVAVGSCGPAPIADDAADALLADAEGAADPFMPPGVPADDLAGPVRPGGGR